jgi:radical S-adenosyl methionine domain-containing protein 2
MNPTVTHPPLPPTVNWHLNRACTMDCRFCFGRFEDVPADLIIRDRARALRVVTMLAEVFDKVTLTGGEPLLCPDIVDLLATCRQHGRTTMLVSNGSPLVARLELIEAIAPHLDWFGVSIDSARPDVLTSLGRAPRAGAIPPEAYIDVARRLRAHGVRLKLNTVVTRLNVDEDMSAFVEAIAPERWKVFQVMRIVGQNDDRIGDLGISRMEFERFARRHEGVGVRLLSETNDEMTGSYAMLDPAGRFFDNTRGMHRYSRPVLRVGVLEAFRDVDFDHQKFSDRGGLYDW